MNVDIEFFSENVFDFSRPTSEGNFCYLVLAKNPNPDVIDYQDFKTNLVATEQLGRIDLQQVTDDRGGHGDEGHSLVDDFSVLDKQTKGVQA